MSRGELEQTLVPASQPGDVFGSADTIGTGGQAIVRRVHDKKLDRVLAMKVLKPELARRAAEVGRFVD
jgi:hypothetical protein